MKPPTCPTDARNRLEVVCAILRAHAAQTSLRSFEELAQLHRERGELERYLTTNPEPDPCPRA